ncbi:GroES-like zinc-binding alcohol dehydrogenase family protein [Actinidia rufa]|uniref:GroES-like zinc-binding alcohol dehydrogenase family protein n=1 Tax=Actinidia rufa TaxID=165716 RepID=A0A7J0ECS5_9ERIC|nr:GroES-like zinc-binding alcohol dehydrogenase family protein [Actinidia rufa]
MVHPTDLCFKLPDNVSLEEGQCVSPLVSVLMLVVAPKLVLRPTDGYRLSVSKGLGADEIVEVSTNMQNCSCFRIKTMSTALSATHAGGKVCLVGMGHNEMTVPLAPAAAREVNIVGVFRYKNTWPLCIEFLRSGKLDVKHTALGSHKRRLKKHLKPVLMVEVPLRSCSISRFSKAACFLPELK